MRRKIEGLRLKGIVKLAGILGILGFFLMLPFKPVYTPVVDNAVVESVVGENMYSMTTEYGQKMTLQMQGAYKKGDELSIVLVDGTDKESILVMDNGYAYIAGVVLIMSSIVLLMAYKLKGCDI